MDPRRTVALIADPSSSRSIASTHAPRTSAFEASRELGWGLDRELGVDHAREVLADFALFWQNETDPDAKRHFLNLIFDNVWLDQDRIVAVQPKPSFMPFFQAKNRSPKRKKAGVNDGSDGTRTRDLRRDRPAL